jgi:hypothetical protein
VTLPLVVILALIIGNITGDAGSSSGTKSPSALPALTVAAPPLADAHAAQCTKVIEKLPVTLDGLEPRVVHPHPDSPYVLAWGDPAVVFECGVARPASLHAGSSAQYFLGGVTSGPWYDVTSKGGANVWTTVDRAVYIALTVPAKYHAGPVPPVSRAIASVLPPVCSTDATKYALHPDKLCTRRR